MAKPAWNVDERIAIHVARFDQRDRGIGVFGEITRNDAAGRARANNDNVVTLPGHQRLSLSQYSYRSINAPSRRLAIAAPDPATDWTLLLEGELATPAREITSRHGVDRRSLLSLAAPHDAVAKNATSRIAPRSRVLFSSRV
ncbi:hypothetical protein ACVWW3_005857 [Bradyrhizobium sp. LM2.9]